MKKICHKIADILRTIFGYGILTALFAGGLTFFGFLAALVIGGDTAALICRVIYKGIFPVIVYSTTIMVLLGLLIMYLSGETALTVHKKKAIKHEGET